MRSISGNSTNRWPRLAEKRGMYDCSRKNARSCTRRVMMTTGRHRPPVPRDSGPQPVPRPGLTILAPKNPLIFLAPRLLPTARMGLFVVDGRGPSGCARGRARARRAARGPMNDAILQEIADFCRQAGLAESTFGRRAVNDGKLASRLRNGGRITTDTLDRIRAFMASHQGRPALARPLVIERSPMLRAPQRADGPVAIAPGSNDPQRNFRFFDNRQKYLLFVNTCSEKWVVASRVSLELGNIHPRPPAVRVFDAGVGDGSVLVRVMRSMHDRFPHMPFYAVGKEISLEDIRLTLQKMADRFLEHPQTVLVLTNLAYADAPWLAVKSLSAASSMVWHELPLAGSTAHKFESQIMDLEPFLAENWKAGVSPKTGNPGDERPVVMVIYRDDHKFLLDPIIPKPGGTVANYDLVIASQPYRARASVDFKAKRVIAPLARALGPGGRLLAIHSYGHDPGMEIIRKVWPDDNPFTTDRHQILKAVKHELGPAERQREPGSIVHQVRWVPDSRQRRLPG